MVRAAMRWTGGHPYLTLKLCDELARRRPVAPEDVNRMVERMYPRLEVAKGDEHFEAVLPSSTSGWTIR